MAADPRDLEPLLTSSGSNMYTFRLEYGNNNNNNNKCTHNDDDGAWDMMYGGRTVKITCTEQHKYVYAYK